MEALSASTQDDSSGANPSSVKSDDSSPHHESGRGSPPPNCAICLGTCKNKSFTDSCLHQFCFKCLLTWSRVKAECPLCKQNFRSIIHNVRSNHQYEEYMVEQRQTEETIERLDFQNLNASTRQRFRYRTTLTLPRRETIAIQQLLLQQFPLMGDMFLTPEPSLPPPARRRRSPAAFRRTVYRHNLWARPLPDFTGRFRDCSPEFYRYNDSQMHRLVPWLNRELHYLLNENIGHISYVIARILELLPQYHINSTEFREAIQVYFRDRTEHFLHELYCFASTPYDMTGYDRNVQYTTDTRISTMVNEVISSSESDASVDSDIVMVSSSEPAEPPPGPSRLPAPVYPQNYIPPPATNNVIPIETISHSDTDDDDEVMVVGYIKPPQDRTPEVVDLLGSDSDVIVQDTTPPEPQPHTSEGQDGVRPVPLVKLTLKRHAMEDKADSDSDDDSSYTPPPPTKRRKRQRSNDTATTSDTCRTTPSPAPTWESNASSETPSSLFASPSSSSSLSSSSDDDYLSSESSDHRRRRLSTKKKVKSKTRVPNSAGSDKKKYKKRKRNQRKEKQAAPLEKDKNSKRKSNSGKGVKSSKKNVSENGPEQAVASLDQPSTSSSCRHNKPSKSRKRRRQSRENKRLKSVVNVMRHQKSGESYANPSVSATTNSCAGNDYLDAQNIQQYTSSNVAVPSTSRKEDTDSEDNLPLNLTIQKTYMSL